MNQFIIVTHATLAGGFADVVRFFKSDSRMFSLLMLMWSRRNLKKSFGLHWKR